jgi:carboxymethylenebutenolidase
MTEPIRRKRSSDFHPEVLRLFDKYVHGNLDRRGFLDGAARFAAGAGGAVALLAALSPDFARGQQVAPQDARIRAQTVTIDAPQGHGRIRAYLVRPASTQRVLPTVLVAHENRGLNPHIEDIARRLALDGFIALAPDALSPLGGYPGNEDAARALFAQLESAKTSADFIAAAHWLQRMPGGNGRLGVVGFCWGGGIANLLATQMPELQAAVPFYGNAAPLDGVARIKARLLLVFAEDDPRINAGWPAYEAALKAAGVRYEAQVYPGTQHGFNNDTTPRYDEAAAKQAWARTIALFDTTLRD